MRLWFSRSQPSAIALMCAPAVIAPLPVTAQSAYSVKPVAQKKLKELPPGPLYGFSRIPRASMTPKAAVRPPGRNPVSAVREPDVPDAEVAAKVWVLTLGPKGASTPGGMKVAEVGRCRLSPLQSTSCA